MHYKVCFFLTMILCYSPFTQVVDDVECPVCEQNAVMLFGNFPSLNPVTQKIADKVGAKRGRKSSSAEYVCCTALLGCAISNKLGLAGDCWVCNGPNPPYETVGHVGGSTSIYCHCGICNHYCTTRWSVSQQEQLEKTHYLKKFTKNVAFEVLKQSIPDRDVRSLHEYYEKKETKKEEKKKQKDSFGDEPNKRRNRAIKKDGLAHK